MIAIIKNGTVNKVLLRVPKAYTYNNITYRNIDKLSTVERKAINIYKVLIPEYNTITHTLGETIYDSITDTVITTIVAKILPDLEIAKLDKIAILNEIIHHELNKTDWVIIKELDTGIKTKPEYLLERANIRTQSANIKAIINSLTTTIDVLNYNIPVFSNIDI